MTFNIFTTKRISCLGQYDRIDDLIPCKLRGDKRPVFRQFLVDEFHFSAVFKCFDPLLVWHFRTHVRCRRGSGCDYSLVFPRLPRTTRAAAWFTSSFRADLAMRGFAISFLTPATVPLPNSFLTSLLDMRSEERRVGKECRSRWSS